jgi:DNA-binding transcriptional LysR family regulator
VFPRVEVRHLHAVIGLAEDLNFTRAADRLHITQSALSKQITEIEEQHRFHLFTRKNRKNVELAEVGRIFVEESRSALLPTDRAIQLGRAAHEGSDSSLTEPTTIHDWQTNSLQTGSLQHSPSIAHRLVAEVALVAEPPSSLFSPREW